MTLRERLRGIANTRFRISTQLYAGLGAAVAFTLLASLVAWFSFNRVGEAQSRVNEGSVPQMSSAFRIAQRAGDLVNAAPRLVAAATPEALAEVKTSIDQRRAAFEQELGELRGEDPRHDLIRQRGEALTANINAIEASVAQSLELAAQRQRMADEVGLLQAQLSRDILLPAIDDQFFYTITGYRTLDAGADARGKHLSVPEVAYYRSLADLHNYATQGAQLLLNAFSLADAPLLEPLRDRFNATAGSIERHLASLPELEMRTVVAAPFARLRALGLGEQGGFAVRNQELTLARDQQALLATNGELIQSLVDEVEGLVTGAQASATNATEAAAQTIGTGRALLLALNIISVVGAALIAWLFVGRVLLRRIGRLSDRMRAMADGDLEAAVDIGGRDEVADMAAALEVFRRHALEVQRLNLVEKLAEELRGKNDQLETALSDLEQAQDQIVAREKLAALGELTAGVAHEIKNPLNFVKNFSEASAELVDELKEVLEELPETETGDDAGEGGEGGEGGDNPREMIQEICQDLVENLTRIRSHGDRADRIVRDMLAMGRGSGRRQPTDINTLVDEHTRLAFHAVRAQDPDFQLDIQKEFDTNVGELDVVPQDLGRVFLNIVTNACYAVDERRRTGGDADFSPTLKITSRRLEDSVEIAIRDNGTGMPKEVADKIFNPFFTTKPTDQGTGLGLSLSADIARQHGGEIRVQSEPGEFTEMTVRIPLVAPEGSAEEAEEETDEGPDEDAEGETPEAAE